MGSRLARELSFSALRRVAALNRERRHETLAERATAAAKLANLKHGGDRSKTPIGVLKEKPLVTVEEAAKKLGVGSGSVDRARAVLAKAEPEIVEKMSKGESRCMAVLALSAIALRMASGPCPKMSYILPVQLRQMSGRLQIWHLQTRATTYCDASFSKLPPKC